MKNILLSLVLVAFLLVPFSASAVTVVQLGNTTEDPEALFDVQTVDINRIQGTEIGKLDFKTNLLKPAGIDHWKIRIWCNDGVAAGYELRNVNHCGQVVVIPAGQTPSTFSLYVTGFQNQVAEFSFKLKAYDKDGNWLYSDREAFVW